MNTRPTRKEDCIYLATRLRQADLDEVKAASGLDPCEALLEGLFHSQQCHTVVDGDTPLAVFGVCPAPLNDSVGIVWLLGSDALKMHSIEFLRKSKGWVDELHKAFPVLYNNIDARNTVHIKWLQWLGFNFINEIPEYGVERRPFYHFVRIDSNV
jgi:hypothetical protein